MARTVQNIFLLGVMVLLLWELSRFSEQLATSPFSPSHTHERIFVDQNSTQLLDILQQSLSLVHQVNTFTGDKSEPSTVSLSAQFPLSGHKHDQSVDRSTENMMTQENTPLIPPPLPVLPLSMSLSNSRTSQPPGLVWNSEEARSSEDRKTVSDVKTVREKKPPSLSSLVQDSKKEIEPKVAKNAIVHSLVKTAPLSHSSGVVSEGCTAGSLAYYSATPNSRVPTLKIPVKSATRCKYSVKPKDIVAGVWHCKKCEPQLLKVRDTWGARLTTVYLASAVGAQGSGFKDIIITDEPKDDYLSTLGKGLLGLKHMYQQFPEKKWFIILGDDVYVHADNLADMLSPFNPDDDWTFSQSSPHPRHGFRAFGGAGIITSRSITKKLVKLLEPWWHKTARGSNNDRLHDIAFVRLLATLKEQKLSHLDGLYSQPPGFYLSNEGKIDVPRGLPLLSATFHYIKGDYMQHLDSVAYGVDVVPDTNKRQLLSYDVYVLALVRPPASEAQAAEVIKQTWGQGLTYAVTNTVNSYEDLPQHLPDKFQWLFVVSSTTYVVPGNLRYALSLVNASHPTLVACKEGAHANNQMPSVNAASTCGFAMSRALVQSLLSGRGVKQALQEANIVFHPHFSSKHLLPSPSASATSPSRRFVATVPFRVAVDKENKKRMRHDEGHSQLKVVHYLLTGVRARALHIDKCAKHQCDF